MAVDEVRAGGPAVAAVAIPRAASPARTPPQRFAQVDALDGVRAVAVLAVIVYHAWRPILPGGFLGVDVFFVLSGFLITGLLLHERATTGRIRLLRFYGRRALRLLPPLVPLLLAALVYAWLDRGSPSAQPTLQGVRATVGYASNWVTLQGVDLGWLAHTWSLSLEEQFYAVWPLLLIAVLLLGGRPAALAVCVIGIAAALEERTLMALHGTPFPRMHLGLDTRADALLFGCGLAVAADLELLRRLRVWLVAASTLVALTVLGALALRLDPPEPVGTLGFTAVAACATVLVAALAVRPWRPLRRLFEAAPLVAAGRMSYAMYLWHYPIYRVLVDGVGGLPPPVLLALVLGLTWLAASISYRLIERPCTALRRRLSAPVLSAGGGGVASPA